MGGYVRGRGRIEGAGRTGEGEGLARGRCRVGTNRVRRPTRCRRWEGRRSTSTRGWSEREVLREQEADDGRVAVTISRWGPSTAGAPAAGNKWENSAFVVRHAMWELAGPAFDEPAGEGGPAAGRRSWTRTRGWGRTGSARFFRRTRRGRHAGPAPISRDEPTMDRRGGKLGGAATSFAAEAVYRLRSKFGSAAIRRFASDCVPARDGALSQGGLRRHLRGPSEGAHRVRRRKVGGHLRRVGERRRLRGHMLDRPGRQRRGRNVAPGSLYLRDRRTTARGGRGSRARSRRGGWYTERPATRASARGTTLRWGFERRAPVPSSVLLPIGPGDFRTRP